MKKVKAPGVPNVFSQSPSECRMGHPDHMELVVGCGQSISIYVSRSGFLHSAASRDARPAEAIGSNAAASCMEHWVWALQLLKRLGLRQLEATTISAWALAIAGNGRAGGFLGGNLTT